MTQKAKSGFKDHIFASIVENAGALISLVDKDGMITYANPAFCHHIGCNETEADGLNIKTTFPDCNLEEIGQTLQEQPSWQNDLESPDAQGNMHWFKTTVSLCEGSYLWVQTDISAHKEEEIRQLTNEKKLQSLLDNIPAYIYLKNKKGEYTYANQMLAALHALKYEQVIGRTDFDLHPSEAAEVFTKNDAIVFEQGKTVRALEHGGIDEYGIERNFLSVKCPLTNEQGEVEELLGMSVDISEQQRLEKALLASQEKLNSILDNMKARVYIKDMDLRYTYANEELCQTLKMDRSSIVGKSDYDLFEPETAVCFRTTDHEVLQTRQKVFRTEMSVDPHTKEKHHFWSVKVPLMGTDGVPHSILGISSDVTEQKRLEERLRANERKLTTILDNLKAHVYIKDINYVYTYVNANMCEYLGKSADEVIGKSDAEVFGEKAADRFHQSDRQVFNYRESCTSIEQSRHYQTGDTCYFLSVKAPLINDLGNAYAILGISTDVTERQRLEKKLREMASTDVLTGTNNRRHFLELCEREIDRAKRYGNALSLVMLDVDHFKRINDTYGHAAGDEAIRTMTKICQQNLRNSDILGRIGGEEFAILLPETNLTGAWQIAQRIRANTEEHSFEIDAGLTHSFTASFGLTSLVKTDESPDDMLKRADIALYQAKSQGRNRVCEKLE